MPETWLKPSTPILTGTLAWENGQVGEPAVVRPEVSASGMWEIFYQAGWNASQIGKAVCVGGNPENPAHWQKRAVPVVGTGAGNFWAAAAHHDVVVIDGVYYLFFTTTNIYGAHIWMATSQNGETFSVQQIPVLLGDTQDAVMGNSGLLIEGDVLYNFYDAIVNPYSGTTVWKTFLARASVKAPWQMEKMRGIPSLQIGSGCYGGMAVRKVNGKYNTWSINAPAGNTPSYIYHHYSQEGVNWGPLNGGSPVLTLTSPSEGDQIADPDVQDCGDHSLMFYSTVNNPIAEGRVWVARCASPLAGICP